MFVPADAVPLTFDGLGHHSFFWGCDSFFLVQWTYTAKSGCAFLTISWYWASTSSIVHSRYILRFWEWLSPSGHQRGRWYLSSYSLKFSLCDDLAYLSWGGIGPRRWNTETPFASCFRGPHSGQLLMVGSRLILEFQQYLKKGQYQWSHASSHLFKLFPVWCSYSSSSDLYWRCYRYWYSYFLSRCVESGSWYCTCLTYSSVMYSLSPFRARSWGLVSYPVFMPKPNTHRMYGPGSIVPHVRPIVLTDNQLS
jgi:hypothetical protein